ncbi:MAG: type IV conjugative transfer system coupling protein TraD [Rhodospirillales bacterium CG15_BIG_FIL_POST_REV_8_21_14_020_66_15]|nr:MAG: type IV conjugative transfer system coupling protein TraD [Rhodospirillales bacterium CG15_BIG_FIL_POST_REV_8_21_14_020_66_15]
MRNSSFIRGGQTTLHEYRMTMQVGKTLAWIVSGVAALVMGVKLAINLSLHEVYQWYVWHWAQFLYLASFKYTQEITIYDYAWQPYVTYTGAIVEHPGMTATKDKVESLMFSGAGLGLVIGVIVALVLAALFLWRGHHLKKAKHLRGSQLLDAPELVRLVQDFNNSKRRNKDKEKPYAVAGIPYPVGAPATHTLICGTTGAGKTTVIAELIEQIRRNGDRAIVYDKTGGFVRAFFDPARDVLCNPFDARAPHWSVFSEGRKASDFEMMAKALIPEQKGMVDPFWVLAARILFSKIAEGLRREGRPSNARLVSQLLKIDLTDMAALLKNTAAQAIIDEKSPKTALSVRAVMTAYLACLEHLPDDRDAQPFSIREWIEDDVRDGFMFLTSRGDMHESVKGLITCWLEIAVNTLLSLEQSRERKVWIILDEVPSLYNIPSLHPGMAESRQFGGCFVLGLQVWSAMRDIYGTNGAETLSGLARTRVVLSTPDKATADWCSQALGNAEATELHETLSYGAHEMRDGVSLAARNELRPIVLPTEIMGLPDLTGYLRLPQGFPVTRFSVKTKARQETARAFVERPETPPPAMEPEQRLQAELHRAATDSAAKSRKPKPKPEPKPAPEPKRETPPPPAPEDATTDDDGELIF